MHLAVAAALSSRATKERLTTHREVHRARRIAGGTSLVALRINHDHLMDQDLAAASFSL
jgi:hypothetical protein